MNTERTSMSFLLTACCLFSGCAALSSDGTSLSKAATERSGQPDPSPVFRAQNNRQWIMRLKIAKPIEALAGRTPTPGASNSLPIPLPQTSQEQYALVIDQSQQLAWLQGSNNYGPFPVSNPDVTHLMNSVAVAYQEHVAWQASMQQTAMQQTAIQQAVMQQPSGQPSSVQQAVYQQPAMQKSAQQQASFPSEFQTDQQQGKSLFGVMAPQPTEKQPTAAQQIAPTSYASEFDDL